MLLLFKIGVNKSFDYFHERLRQVLKYKEQ